MISDTIATLIFILSLLSNILLIYKNIHTFTAKLITVVLWMYLVLPLLFQKQITYSAMITILTYLMYAVTYFIGIWEWKKKERTGTAR